MHTRRLTMGQALVAFLTQQYVARDGVEHRFFPGVLGIFGHGNVAGLGEALLDVEDRLPYVLVRNEQAMVHTAIAYAKRRQRLQAWACTSSIGPGATNMLTGAAAATINRLPVLLLPGDIFANRRPDPVLQQLESPWSRDLSVNDCFKPVARYWDRVNRPEQLIPALLEAMRVLTSPADTGAVVLALPQDVQAEAFDYPAALFERRVWSIPRPRPDATLVREAARRLVGARTPLLIAGGGVLYSEATGALRRLVEATGLAVAETQAGKGSLPWDHPQQLGAMGVTGGLAANRLGREADLVLLVGTRLTDFTSASRSAFAHPDVSFVAINVAESDAHKAGAFPLVGDARVTLEELLDVLTAGSGSWQVPEDYRARVAALRSEWLAEVDAAVAPRGGSGLTQLEVIGELNHFVGEDDTVVCAAGSLPGDLHRFWRASRPGTYHLEYGYSTMGYEIAGGLGVSLAAPGHETYVLVGDGSCLMMSSEVVTAIQEGARLTILLLDNRGFASIGGLSASVGCGGFGTRYRRRDPASGRLDGDWLTVDFRQYFEALGAHAVAARDLAALRLALADARRRGGVNAIIVEVDPEARAGSYDTWWDVPVAEVSAHETVRAARAAYDAARRRQRYLI